MKLVVRILVALAIILIGFAIFVATRPSSFVVERSAVIAATPSRVFEQVNDVHKFQQWSPWADIDPSVKMTYEGPSAGTGASFHWEGNSEVGAGRMTVIESSPPVLVRFKLEFEKPFKATNEAEFDFTPEAGGTRVRWNMTGTNNFMFKAVGVFMNMDQMVGKDFEKGLARLKKLAETPAHP